MPSATTKKPAAEKPSAKPATKAAKPAAKPPAAPKVASVAKPAAESVSVVKAGGALRAKDLVARVAEATGAKVKDVKLAVEATLSEIGKALDAGEALNLPPLGRVKITPAKGEGSTQPMKLKLRRGAGQAGKNKLQKEALAEVGEDS